jgi:hypothetical protein
MQACLAISIYLAIGLAWLTSLSTIQKAGGQEIGERGTTSKVRTNVTITFLWLIWLAVWPLTLVPLIGALRRTR